MSYAVKETYFTLQGEGANVGRAAVFLRFSGCNLWSGREEDREAATGSCGRWCDTDFVGMSGPGGGRFTSAEALAQHVSRVWKGPATAQAPRVSTAGSFGGGRTLQQERSPKLVVCTGGEPLLQLDEALLDALHAEGFWIAIETNGTLPVPPGVDWVCVSPKAGTELVVRRGNELKLVFPQEGLDPGDFEGLAFDHFFLQPMDGPCRACNTKLATDYCLAHPVWRMSLQTHKYLGIP